MHIEKVSNGYIVIVTSGLTRTKEIYTTIEGVLAKVMFHFEDKSPFFSGSTYAKITVEYDKEKK